MLEHNRLEDCSLVYTSEINVKSNQVISVDITLTNGIVLSTNKNKEILILGPNKFTVIAIKDNMLLEQYVPLTEIQQICSMFGVKAFGNRIIPEATVGELKFYFGPDPINNSSDEKEYNFYMIEENKFPVKVPPHKAYEIYSISYGSEKYVKSLLLQP